MLSECKLVNVTVFYFKTVVEYSLVSFKFKRLEPEAFSQEQDESEARIHEATTAESIVPIRRVLSKSSAGGTASTDRASVH